MDKIYKVKQEVFNLGGQLKGIYLDVPQKCPKCEYNDTLQLKTHVSWEFPQYLCQLSVIFKCCHCKMPTYAIYLISGPKFSPSSHLIDVFPRYKRASDFDSIISEISPRFIEIYNQAYVAEQNNLTELCGMGYRKAFEIFIKDYVLSKENYSDSYAATIRNEQISATIDRLNSDAHPLTKELAKRVIWLCNDQTHYSNYHPDKNITDIKQLINDTLYWLCVSIRSQQYINDIKHK